jgi:hypothetical protein
MLISTGALAAMAPGRLWADTPVRVRLKDAGAQFWGNGTYNNGKITFNGT